MTRIGVVAPANMLNPKRAEQAIAVAGGIYPHGALELVFHPQCFRSHGHFAGTDKERADAFLEIANDPAFDAVWFARGGYGSGRILEAVIPHMNAAAKAKTYMGYSDMGALLGALYAHGYGRPVHGPMVVDVGRKDVGPAIAEDALRFLVDGDTTRIEPHALTEDAPMAAFNLSLLTSILGTKWEPSLAGHAVMIEDVNEYAYSIDRMMFQFLSRLKMRAIKGIYMGRFAPLPDNDPAWGEDIETTIRGWCVRSGVAFLGKADIGHDGANKIVPFGRRWQGLPARG